MSSTTATPQDVTSINEFLNIVAIETGPLFEYPEFGFLSEYDVFERLVEQVTFRSLLDSAIRVDSTDIEAIP